MYLEEWVSIVQPLYSACVFVPFSVSKSNLMFTATSPKSCHSFLKPNQNSPVMEIEVPFAVKVHKTVKSAQYHNPAPTSGLLITVCAKRTEFIVGLRFLRGRVNAIASADHVSGVEKFLAVL